MTPSETNLPLWLAFLSLNEQAMRDWLTGLHNRRYFEETLPDHISAATRYNRELSLVIFDIDDFKQINDTHGHAAGDAALREFATLLKTTARKADMVCRYGGDEFAVLLPETGPPNARKFTERVFQTLKSSNGCKFTVTAGIAALPCESITANADADLLKNKHAKKK